MRRLDRRKERGGVKKLLCKPCAVALADRGKTVKPAAMRCEKITCAECGRHLDTLRFQAGVVLQTPDPPADSLADNMPIWRTEA